MKNKCRQAQFLLRSITDDVPQLLLEENNLVFRNELKEDILIPCSSIISIKILPINRIYNPSVGLLKDGMKGFMAHRNAGVFSIYFNYFIDLNVVTTTNTYLFESLDLENASQFILKLDETIKIIDDVNLIDLFKTKSISELKEYMDKHYKDWAKKYNLENPRTTLDENMIRLARKKNQYLFEKQDCWFSMEIEIHKGHDSLNMIDDGKDILNDFDGNPSVTIERKIVEIV